MKYTVSVLPDQIENYTHVIVNPSMAIDQISNKIEDEEATDLIAEYLLEYYKHEDQDKVLGLLAKKTRIGGCLTVSVINGRKAIYHLTESVFNNANEVLFGKSSVGDKQLKPIRSMCFDVGEFIKKLDSYGIRVVQTLEDNFRQVFVCQKTR